MSHPMMTIDYTIGETKVWRVNPRTSAGATPDLTGVTANLRISMPGGTCLSIDGSGDGYGYSFLLSPATVDLSPERHAATLWMTWAGGERLACGLFMLNVRKGC